jgi:tetratricopeptide (TPR) repeat protein
MKGFLLLLAVLGIVVLVLWNVQGTSAEVLGHRAREAYGTGDYARAITLYSQAIAAGSRDGRAPLEEAYTGRGQAYLKAGNIQAAQADFAHAIETNRQHAAAHLGLCTLLAEHVGSEEALPACLQAVKLGQPLSGTLKPKLETTLCRLAEAAYSRGDDEDFLRRHRELEALSPNLATEAFSKSRLAQSHYRLGDGLLRKGEPDTAAEHYRAAIDIDPGSNYRRRAVAALFSAGERSESAGSYERAVTCYERALDLAEGPRGEIEARLDGARRMERCYRLKNTGDAALQRIDWPLVERANEILGPFNQGIEPSLEEAFFISSNARELAESVSSLVEAHEAYRGLMNAHCPSHVADDALRSNINLILLWADKAGAITEFLVQQMKK